MAGAPATVSRLLVASARLRRVLSDWPSVSSTAVGRVQGRPL